MSSFDLRGTVRELTKGFELFFRLSGMHIKARKEFLKIWLVGRYENKVGNREMIIEWATDRPKVSGMGMKLLFFVSPARVSLWVLGKDSRWLGETIFCLIDCVRKLVALIRERKIRGCECDWSVGSSVVFQAVQNDRRCLWRSL